MSQEQNIHEDNVQMYEITNETNQVTTVGQNNMDQEPKLYVDVNVAHFGLQRIVVYEGDTVESLVADFVQKCPIDEAMIEKLKGLLKQQIDGVLERIDEDEEQKTENSGEEIYDENGQMTASSQKINRSEGAGKQNSSSTRKIINNMVQNDEGV